MKLRPGYDPKKCHAMSKRSGNQCQNPPKTGSNVCRMHGANSLKGMAHPNFKDGRKSKYMPVAMLDAYRDASGDPDLISLREDIIVLDARVASMLQRVESGESMQTLEDIREKWQAYKIASRNKTNKQGIRDTFNALEDAITSVYTDHAAWKDIEDTIDRKRRLIADERKRLVDLHQVMTIDRVMNLFQALLTIVEQEIPDRNALQRISDGAIRLLNVPEAS